jgi:hypothetical protein
MLLSPVRFVVQKTCSEYTGLPESATPILLNTFPLIFADANKRSFIESVVVLIEQRKN